MQPHRNHQPRRAEQGHCLLGPLHLQLAAAAAQGRAQQPLAAEALEQTGVLIAVERQPQHLAVGSLSQQLKGMQVGPPGLSLQLGCGAPADNDRTAAPNPGLRRQRPDRIGAVGSPHPQGGRQLRRLWIAPADARGGRQQGAHQGAAATPPQRPQPLRPEQHRFALQPGGADQQPVIEQAAETGGILQQAAAAEHQGPAAPEGRQHRLETAALHRGHAEALSHLRFIEGRHEWRYPGGHQLQKGFQQRIVAEVVLSVIPAQQHRQGIR